jgi:microcystin-dependent protein
MAEPFIGEIRILASNYAPQGWAMCRGQLVPINQNMALFSLLGTTFGGNGQTNFGLPNLNGRAPVGYGAGPGLTPRQMGETFGSETVALTAAQMPAHTHNMVGTLHTASSSTPANNVLAAGQELAYAPPPSSAVLAAQAIGATGGSQPHDNMQPYLPLTFVIALSGIFPPRT